MLLENCIFRRDVKGKYTDSSVWKGLRGACRVVGNERCACELSFGSEMETEAAVSTTTISVAVQDLHSLSPGWKLSAGVWQMHCN